MTTPDPKSEAIREIVGAATRAVTLRISEILTAAMASGDPAGVFTAAWITSAPLPSEIIQAGDITINVAERTTIIGGRKVKLTAKEFDILYVLALRPNRVCEYAYIISQVWGNSECCSIRRTLNMHISNLRRKIGDVGSGRGGSRGFEFIETVPGVGYKLISND